MDPVLTAHAEHVISERGIPTDDIVKLRIDKESDALYFRLDESSVVESEEVRPGVILDFDINGNVVGLEMLKVSTRVDPGSLSSLHFDTA